MEGQAVVGSWILASVTYRLCDNVMSVSLPNGSASAQLWSLVPFVCLNESKSLDFGMAEWLQSGPAEIKLVA